MGSKLIDTLEQQHAKHDESDAGSVNNEASAAAQLAASAAQLEITELKQKLKITEQGLEQAETAANDAKQQACEPDSDFLRVDSDQLGFPSCNWQCYLDNYADLQKDFGSNQSKAKSHYQTSGQKEGRNCRCDTSAVAVAAADSSGRHVWCVLLSATLAPFISLSNNSWSKHKNHDPAKRMAEYARSLELWANRTSMPIIFADNSGDAERLANITGGWKARLPKKRMQLVEVLNIPRSSVCGGKEIGCHEGHLVMTAVQQSQLVKSCTHVLKVTGRWFPHHIESVLGMCRRPELRLVVQNPRWRGDPDDPKSGWRQETQVLGFDKRFIHELFGWAESKGAACMECHIGSKVSAWRKNANINTICDMPPLLLDTKFSPRGGSTGILRNSLR